MKNSMIIEIDDRHIHHFVCPCCRKSDDRTIPVFYSAKHARECGWKYTKNINYCPPENIEIGAWVCPECWSVLVED